MIVTIASAWNASNGGINAFNIELTRALARVLGKPIGCAVTDFSPEEKTSAAAQNVTLIKVSSTSDGKPARECESEIMTALGTDTTVSLWVGHDLVSGEAAARAATAHGGQLALVHHMDYQSYQNISGSRGDETHDNHSRQISLFRTKGATLFGIGSWLTDNAGRLAGQQAHLLVPGFPSVDGSQGRASTDRLRILTAGRFDEQTEPLKRGGIALDAFATALRDPREPDLLRHASMTMLGVDEPGAQVELHKRAEALAGRRVEVIAASYRDNPEAFAQAASVAHLVIVPSRHEGFSLVGWEAIGTETPLIIGSNTGLARLLRTTLDGQEAGLVTILDLDGSDNDRERISSAIRDVAAHLPQKLRNARRLRSRLQAELRCTWDEAARVMLTEVGLLEPPRLNDPAVRKAATFSDRATDHHGRCVELGASAGQGSMRQSLELLAELRFGSTAIRIEDIEAEIGLSKATLEVKPKTGRIAKGDRLGEGGRPMPGVEARSGGIWLIEPTDVDVLAGKVLGSEALCIVETQDDEPVVIDLEVTAMRRDIRCTLRAKRQLNKNQEKVIEAFLKQCIFKPDSGDIIFSTATLSEIPDDQ